MSSTSSTPPRSAPTPHSAARAYDHLPHGSATAPAQPTRGRALVLGGGGSTGNAWLIGVIAGLFDAGVDVTAPDVTIGTSAGATTAAQIAAATPAELYAGVLTAPSRPHTTSVASDRGRAPATAVADHLERLRAVIASSDGIADMRRRIGAAALDQNAVSDGSWQARWRSTVAARLPSQHWPEHTVLITAVDAGSGDPVVFDRASGVELVDAVAASCSSGRPYRIGGHWYIDGGYRSNAENADLAAGRGRVLVLAPFGGRTLHPLEWGTHLAAQIEDLRAHGSNVEMIAPDGESEHLFGADAMDLSLRPAAARAGRRQGAVLANRLGEFWR